MRRLWPDPVDDVEVAEQYRDPGRGRHDDGRPWLMVSMVASLDGATAVAGRSGALGGEGDRAVFSAMRSLADVVLVGAATVRTEQYRPPRKEGQRIAIVSATVDLDWSSELMRHPAALVVTTAMGKARVPADVEVLVAGSGHRVDVAQAVRALPGEVVVCEGGPSINAQVLDLVDEWCATIDSVLVGGESNRPAHGPEASPPVSLELVTLLEQDSVLFGRWRRRR